MNHTLAPYPRIAPLLSGVGGLRGKRGLNGGLGSGPETKLFWRLSSVGAFVILAL